MQFHKDTVYQTLLGKWLKLSNKVLSLSLLMGKCTCVPSDAVIVAASAKYTNTRGLGVKQGVS